MSHIRLNSELVEKFGELEQLCNQIYGETHGVTQYINQMNELQDSGRRRVAGWDAYYRNLKTARHKRNLLSHGEVSFSEPCADQSDIDFIAAFRKSILRYKDPISLALNRKATKPAKSARHLRKSAGEENSGCASVLSSFFYVVIFLAVIAALITLIYTMIK